MRGARDTPRNLIRTRGYGDTYSCYVDYQRSRQKGERVDWVEDSFGPVEVHFEQSDPYDKGVDNEDHDTDMPYISGNRVATYVVGPVPEKPFTANPLTRIVHPEDKVPFWGGKSDVERHLKRRNAGSDGS